MAVDRFFAGNKSKKVDDPPKTTGDRTRPGAYIYDERLVRVINVAIATGRPLLLSGEPGTGKTSLAYDIAYTRGWRFYSQTITSRSQAQALMWRFNAVQQIRDVQLLKHELETSTGSTAPVDNVGSRLSDVKYVEPGPLWWAHKPADASRRGATHTTDPLSDPSPFHHDAPYAVVLVDEIDKADPDLPNDLLEIFGSLKFTVTETGHEVKGEHAPLVIITTNQERFLPDAFVRRCICYELPPITKNSLLKVGQSHLGGKLNKAMMEEALDQFWKLVELARNKSIRAPSTAEFLDLLHACNHLDIRSKNDPAWPQQVVDVVWKDSKTSKDAADQLSNDEQDH